jgi:hypothetical protein
MKRSEPIIERREKIEVVPLPVVPAEKDDLKTELAIGAITLSITAFVLFLINSAIYYNYHPDLHEILNKVIPLTIENPVWFKPEPVERLQFELSVLLSPFIIFGAFKLVNRKREALYDRPSLCSSITISGLVTFILYLIDILTQDLANIPKETNTYFFNNNLIKIFNPFLAIVFYCGLAGLFYFYSKLKENTFRNKIVGIIIYGLVAFCVLDVVLFDVLHLADVSIGSLGETNAVFYAITQVCAGKSMLVDINCQYGLFAWMLLPVFKIIGLSTYKFGLVMAALNGGSYLLLYLGLRKIIKQDLLSFFVFICLLFWQFWQTRLPFEETARFYYQYNPIRTFFPFVAFYLIATFATGTPRVKQITARVLAIVSSFAILWNLDSGLVVYAATFITLVLSTLDAAPLKSSLKRSMAYAAWMAGALLFVIVLFLLSTKIRSGEWPDLKHFSDFQQIFYISGFFMLPMTAIHFWNLPAIVYLIAGIYCVYRFRKEYANDVPVVVFLFITGCGLFAYFQGRSYDTTIEIVMYPAIILLGIFCSRLFSGITARKLKFHESMLLFLVAFIFIADGACSMIYNATAIHNYAWNNAFTTDDDKEDKLAQRLDFLKKNIPEKDTVLILAKNYESYYYASGGYYNPLPLPGSTEIIFRTEIDQLLELIKSTKYPIICDAHYYWPCMDTIVEALAKYTTVKKSLASDFTFVLLQPGKKAAPTALVKDANTLYYSSLGDFNKYVNQTSHISFPDNFTVEFIARIDSANLVKDDIVFCTLTQNNPHTGVLMKQDGDDLTRFTFGYGNGDEWCRGVDLKLSCTAENRVLIHVQKNMITAIVNGIPCEAANTNSTIKNNNGVFYLNPHFSGTVNEIKISSQ